MLESIIVRNRIKGHRRVRAGDLLPHELNWRNHSDRQKETLQALYKEVGFARSLLAFELPDGRLKLIDGHLRRDLSPDMFVDVEILDVNEEEARKLLLSLDTLPALAEPDEDVLSQLKEITKTDSPVLAQLWKSQVENEATTEAALNEAEKTPVEQFLILITCRNESHQVELLEKFQSEGIPCRALVS